jgi:hypothetical protein
MKIWPRRPTLTSVAPGIRDAAAAANRTERGDGPSREAPHRRRGFVHESEDSGCYLSLTGSGLSTP